MSLVGTWVPFRHQAIFAETPLRNMRPDDFATLVIEPDGTGCAKRKSLLKTAAFDLTWKKDDEGLYLVIVDDGLMGLYGYIEEDVLIAKVSTEVPMPGMTGMGVHFRRML